MAGRPTSPRRDASVDRPLASSLRDRFRARTTIDEAVRRILAPHLPRADASGRRQLWREWQRTMRLLFPLGAVSVGNQVELFGDGDLVFEAMWRAIDEARREILITTYTLEPDRVGQQTLRALVGACERGCAVTLVYDAVGSHRLDDSHLAPLREAGARIVQFNPVLRFGSRLSRLVRNHQKILVVDNTLGFCGGMNIAEEYAGERYGNGLFRDTHLCVRGPCVGDLSRLVMSAVPESEDESVGGGVEGEGGSLVQILESNVRRQRRAIQHALRVTISRAVERCYLTSPYFVPPARLMATIRRAARRGVDVRILTAGRSDVPIVHLASQHLYGKLLRAGVRIFELEQRTLHAKTTTIDGVYASVGSFNLDYWSYRRNLEVSVCLLDREVAGRVERDFERDLTEAVEVTLSHWTNRTLWERVLHWAAYQLLRI